MGLVIRRVLAFGQELIIGIVAKLAEHFADKCPTFWRWGKKMGAKK
jgi:hypothetical protein